MLVIEQVWNRAPAALSKLKMKAQSSHHDVVAGRIVVPWNESPSNEESLLVQK
jgi:hypothetical protein